MNLKFKLLIVLLSVVFIGTSCGGDDDENITPPNPTSGDIKGSVNLYDEGTTQIDNSNMTIKVEGTSKSGTTDASGDFTISDVPFGTYTLVFEKTGFGTFKKFGIAHNKGLTIITESPSLGEKSTTSITNLSVNIENDKITIGTTINPEASIGNKRYIRYFFSTSNDVSSANFEAVLETIVAEITPYNLNLTKESLESLGFQSGQTVYVKCYGESFWSNKYDDPDAGRTIFPNVNMTSADAVSFEVP